MLHVSPAILALMALFSTPIVSSADQISCADGSRREGLVLEHYPDNPAGLVVAYVPFRGPDVDTTVYGMEVTVWGQRCDVIHSPATQRSAMISNWRKHVLVAGVSRRGGDKVELVRAGFGIGARNAAVCVGYCGRARVLELVMSTDTAMVTLDMVRQVSISNVGDVTVTYRDGSTAHGRPRALDPAPRHYFLYGLAETAPGQLTDVEIPIADILLVTVHP